MLQEVQHIKIDSPTQHILRDRLEEERKNRAEEEERERAEEAKRIANEVEDMNSLLEYQNNMRKKRNSVIRINTVVDQQKDETPVSAVEVNRMRRHSEIKAEQSAGAFKRDLSDYTKTFEQEADALDEKLSSSGRRSSQVSEEDKWMLKTSEQDQSQDTVQLETKKTEPTTSPRRFADPSPHISDQHVPPSPQIVENRYLAKYLNKSKSTMQEEPSFLSGLNSEIGSVNLSPRTKSRSFGSSNTENGKVARPKSNIFDVRKSPMMDGLKVKPSDMVYYIIHVKGKPGDQRNLCFTCGKALQTGFFAPKPRYCDYTGKYHCLQCHSDQRSIIPARILQNWDFKPYPICDASKMFLESTVDDPVYDLSTMSQNLYHKVPNLRNVKILRRQLYYLKDYIFNCERVSQEKVVKEISNKLHIIHNTDIYSLQDLMDLNTEKLVEWIRDLTERFIVHVTKCNICKERGQPCAICHDPSVVYPFNVRTTTECKTCHAPFHRICRRKVTNCPVCEKSDLLRDSYAEDDAETEELSYKGSRSSFRL